MTLKSIIQDLSKIHEAPNTIIAFKGIRLNFIPDSILDNFIDKNFIKNFEFDDDQLFGSLGKRNLLLSLMESSNSTRYITYESLVYGISLINSDLIIDNIVVIDLSIHGYLPNNFSKFKINIEELVESEQEIDIEIYEDVIASSIIINDKIFLQLKDEILNKKAVLIKYFSSIEWNFKELEVLNENDIEIDDLVYNYEDKLFIPFIENILEEKTKKIRVLVDNDTIQDQIAINQLGIILNVFKVLEIDCDLLKIKHDLTKSYRNDLNNILSSYWGSNKFRSLKIYADPDVDKSIIEISQAEVVETIIEQFENGNLKNKDVQDIFLTAPTGAGKSLLFQMPAIYIGEKYNALSIVVSPLKALMVDQVNQLKNIKGYNKVAYINSDITLIERDEIIEQISQGEIDILYMAPELLLSYDMSYFLNGRQLGLYIVDEAHTVSTWGRDFRIDYWYLGYHINRVRKYSLDSSGETMKFPVVAVTATAPYGQKHDVVFETLSSLQMKAPIKYIGYARRDDISFEINHVQIDGNLQTEKINITAERIKLFENNKDKTIIYCPFTTQVNALVRLAKSKKLNTFPYHGSMNTEDQSVSYDNFKNNNVVTMIATKAFGMGVDINNVTRVHHLAPTGLLTDYIQEIGRAARDEKINGIASVDYSIRDFQFINQLHGLSRMFNWQLREVMRRLIRIYDDSKEQNQLITAEDFAHIFQESDSDRLQGEVKKALLLLEKDLNQKFNRIPVIIARPKNMFSTVFASISEKDIDKLKEKIGEKFFSIINYMPLIDKGKKILRIELDMVWENYYRDKAFGIIKRDYFKENLFQNIEVKPKLKIDITLNNSLPIVLGELNSIFTKLENAFSRMNGFFTKEEFAIKLTEVGFNLNEIKRISDFILPMFSQRAYKQNDILSISDVAEYSNFLQAKRNIGEIDMKYRIVDNAFSKLKTNIRRKINSEFYQRKHIIKYVSKDSGFKYLYIKIGQLLEIFELGKYEVTGGENPRIYVRINDPFRLRSEAFSDYQNSLLNDVTERHQSGVILMKEFFESELNSEERWDFIEDFLLGFRC